MDSRGLSLVELLIGIAILAVVSLMVGSVYLSHFRLFSRQNAQIEVSNQNKLALDEMVNQIREGNQVMAQCPLASCLPETSGPNSLVIRLWPIDTSGEAFQPPQDTAANYDYVVYKRDVAKNTLLKMVFPATGVISSRSQSTKIIASDITNLEFNCYGDIAAPGSCNGPSPAAITEVLAKITTQADTFTTKKETYTIVQEARAILRNWK